jgi:hypothetical protein
MEIKYRVTLKDEEIGQLNDILVKSKFSAAKRKRAQALLLANGQDKTDAEIASLARMRRSSIEELRRGFVENGFEACLEGLPRGHRQPIICGEDEASQIALSCEERAEGATYWSLIRLRGPLVYLEGREVSGQDNKDAFNGLKARPRKEWPLPLESNANFVAHMEDILGLYMREPDPARPLVCMGECPKPLIGERRIPLPGQPGSLEKHETEYARLGTADILVFLAPHQGWRRAEILEGRTMIDWAVQIRRLVDIDFPEADKVSLVCDNPDTYRPAALFEAFPVKEAMRIMGKLEIHCTPKGGSWLNMAEIELSSINGHGLSERVPTMERLKREVAAWERQRNDSVKKIVWSFATSEARVKLKGLYPHFES